MIRAEIYQRIAEEFGTGIGVADWDGTIYESYTNIKKIPDEMRVVILTNHIIKKGIYQQVIREVLRLETKYKNKRINKSSIYDKALDMVM